MKKVFLWFAAAAFMLAACSDDSSTQAKGVPDSGEDSPVAEVNKDSSATEPEGDFTVDVPGSDSEASEGKGFFKGSSCQADESLFENAFAGKAPKGDRNAVSMSKMPEIRIRCLFRALSVGAKRQLPISM